MCACVGARRVSTRGPHAPRPNVIERDRFALTNAIEIVQSARRGRGRGRMTIAQHSSETNEHYTPAWLVEAAREVLGRIDLDPASCAIAQEQIQAGSYWDEQQDGLLRPWTDALVVSGPTRVFLNPPGGKLDKDTLQPLPRNAEGKQGGPGVSSAAVWWGKLWNEWQIGHVHSAIFICFSLAVFRTTQEPTWEVPAPFLFPFCVPRERVNYDRVEVQTVADHGAQERLVRIPTKGAPADSAIVYLPDGPRHERDWHGNQGAENFARIFGRFGAVRI